MNPRDGDLIYPIQGIRTSYSWPEFLKAIQPKCYTCKIRGVPHIWVSGQNTTAPDTEWIEVNLREDYYK